MYEIPWQGKSVCTVTQVVSSRPHYCSSFELYDHVVYPVPQIGHDEAPAYVRFHSCTSLNIDSKDRPSTLAS